MSNNTRRFHPLDQVVMKVREQARGAAQQAARNVFGDRITLGSFHTTPGEQLMHFLRMGPQGREQLRETMGEEQYGAFVQMQLEAMATRRGVGPEGAAALFDALGIMGRPTTAAGTGVFPEELPASAAQEAGAGLSAPSAGDDLFAEDEGEPQLIL